MYGATAGKLFAAGQAGERFCVRNSGAIAVVEGCGSNGCEYMTGGTAVILGATGDNFAAGMTGGMAFVLDESGDFPIRVNEESVIYQRIEVPYWEDLLRGLIEDHVAQTQSRFGERVLYDWAVMRGKFWQIVPKEIISRLNVPVRLEAALSAE
jgi:glutamate synthase (NADPH/NADH) large chain